MREQYLDKMDLERERGITIKAQAVRLAYRFEGVDHELNLIDTPGHVDFTYEVSRSLAACEGAVLLVDAAQGIEAQTLANFHLARDAGLVIVPVLNKIDLPQADVDETRRELAEVVGCPPEDVLAVSAKTGEGVTELIEEVVRLVPPPTGERDEAAPGADLRLVVRRVPRGDRVPPGERGRAALELEGAVHGERDRLGGGGGGGLRAGGHPRAEARGRRGRLPRHGSEGRPPGQGRRHGHARRQAGRARAAPRLPRTETDGVERPVPRRGRGLLGAARGARPAEAERRGARLRARDVAGARVRVPVRVPRAAPHGHRQGAARARVRARADRDRAQRRVRRDPRRRDDRGAQPERDAATRDLRPRRGARRPRDGHHAERVPRARPRALPGATRRAPRHAVPLARARRGPLQAPARRDHLRLLRPAEVQDPRVRLARLRADRVRAARTWSGSTSSCTASPSTRSRASSTGRRRRRTDGRWSNACAS